MVKQIEKILQSPFWPAFLSAVIVPGAGQIFNREFKKGIILILASTGTFFWFTNMLGNRLALLLPGSPQDWTQDQTAFKEAVQTLVNQSPEAFLFFQVALIGIWGYSVVNAYRGANRKKNVIT